MHIGEMACSVSAATAWASSSVLPTQMHGEQNKSDGEDCAPCRPDWGPF